MTARIQQELGTVLGGVSYEELRQVATVFMNNQTVQRSVELGVFEGDVLLLAADIVRDNSDTGSHRWEPYVNGHITEVRLPGKNSDMVEPEMLGQAWAAGAPAGWRSRPRWRRTVSV